MSPRIAAYFRFLREHPLLGTALSGEISDEQDNQDSIRSSRNG